MPRRSTEFQRLVALINKCLFDSGKVEESALLIDKVSGKEREVDVHIYSEVADYPVNISIEVRDRMRKADVTWVEAMHAKHSHLPTDKLVLVSRRGFSKPAIEKAIFYGIETITFEEALETPWDIAAQMTSSGVLKITTINYKCSAICDHPDGKQTISPAERETTVFLPYREEPTNFDNMVQFFLSEPRVKEILYQRLESTEDRKFTLGYTPQDGTYVLGIDGTKMPLLKFYFEMDVKHTDTPINFVAGRYGKREVGVGSSSVPETQLHFALVRKQGDKVEGLLLDELGLRKLTVKDTD